MEIRSIRKTALIAALLVAASALLLFAACATTGTTETSAAVESSMRDSYAFRTYLQNDNIMIRTQGDKVTLEGNVPDPSHKFLAEDVARSTVGVKDVDNKLLPEGGTPKKNSDAWLGAQVKARLMMHPDVNAAQTDVYVDKGVVTLKGQAQNNAQRNLAAEYAKNVKGVKEVVNAITVASVPMTPPTMGQVADDAAIVAKAETALDANASTTDLDVTVESSEGLVTVTGTADNQAEKDLVTRIIADIGGVKGVNNEIIVETPAAFVN
jgi:hyperosmotically inducible periplasmic protein